MYKNYSVIVLAFLLSGCPGPGDRIPPKEPANVTLKDNQVCITAPVYPGEFVSSAQFSDGENNNLLKTLEHDPVYVANGQCLPTFGYDFQKGHTYTVFYTIEKNATDSGRYLSAEFSTKMVFSRQARKPGLQANRSRSTGMPRGHNRFI